MENTPEAWQVDRQQRHRAGFEDVVWFRMDIGRRQNAGPLWILPLLCRRGHITRNESGAIRISANDTHFQVPRAVADKFASALARTAGSEQGGEVRIERSPHSARGTAPASKGIRPTRALDSYREKAGQGTVKRGATGRRREATRRSWRGGGEKDPA